MKTYLTASICFALLFLFSCDSENDSKLSSSPLLPLPAEITEGNGRLDTNSGIANLIVSEDLEIDNNFYSVFSFLKSAPVSNGFILNLEEDISLKEEGYRLEVSSEKITISASSQQRHFYGLQTLQQLLTHYQNAIPCGTIEDNPRYEYRGAMLDVSRHFFQVEDVKEYIDYLARYKMNRLHLHLTGDQGWRIEIKSWPKLTELGSSTEVGGGEGGFFTQEQYKELVSYAADRFVTIIPEIDMPGHTNAALVAYAELNCDGVSREPFTGIDVGFSSLCIDKKVTYQFVDDVIREIAEMTPGEYIHIGGDESHSTEKEDFI